MNQKKTGLFVSILLLIVASALSASAKEAYLANIALAEDGESLLVSFRVTDCFTEEMNKAIESGINTTFTYFVWLYEKRNMWWDQKIAAIKLNRSIKYDNLKKIYELRFAGQSDKTVTVKDFEEANDLMAHVKRLRVTPLATLDEGNRYQLRLMAELDKIRLPLYLHYVFFFLSLWDFATPWYKVDFSY
jgi:hypothetical protein